MIGTQHKDMEARGYKAFISGCVLLGYSLDNGLTYIGYDDALAHYYLAVKSTGKIICTSFTVDTLINNWLKFELPLVTCEHKENNVFSYGIFLTVTVAMSKFCVYLDDTLWLASFKTWPDCEKFIKDYSKEWFYDTGVH